jgi:DNA ligase (NAD+)
MKIVDKMREKGFCKSVEDLSISQLCNIIDKADSRYYRIESGSPFSPIIPFMTDEEYDFVKSSLKELDPQNERITRVGIPYNDDNLRSKVKHNIPMGSLDNTDDGILGYSTWLDNVAKSVGYRPEVVASLKIDGASICATYEKGKLIRVATRGNGEFGEDITVNAVNFINLPTVLSSSIDADVRGEAILYKNNFTAICESENIAIEDRSNPRNVGNGILGRDDGRNSNLINFIAFNIETNDIIVNTEIDKLQLMKELGFKPVPHSHAIDEDAFNKFFAEVAAKRDELPFEIDGVVVVVNSIDTQKKFITSDIKTRLRPKYARAVKFPHKFNHAKLLDVELSVGHSRTIVPTAVLEETRVGGVNVTRALLNNWDEINRLGVFIGDTVEVVLAGDIIPKIIRVVEQGEDRKKIEEPSACPSCGSSTSRENRGKIGVNLFCTNLKCEASAIAKIQHWIGTSRKGVGILGIGDSILEVMWRNNIVRDPADLYTMKASDISDLTMLSNDLKRAPIRIGKSRAEQIVKEIQDKKTVSLPVFLGSLGIDLLGKRRAMMLIKDAGNRLSSIHNWLDTTYLKSLDLPGFGDAIKQAVVDGINENRELIDKLLKSGVIIEDSAVKNAVHVQGVGQVVNEIALGTPQPCTLGRSDLEIFRGYSFCLTGTRAHIDDIERLGGTVKSGVSRGLTFLVQADPLSVSGKTKKAEEYGIAIISIDYLKQAIDGKVVLEP